MKQLTAIIGGESSSTMYLYLATTILLGAMYMGGVGWGTYSRIGALLLILAIAFAAHAISASKREQGSLNSGHVSLLLIIFSAVILIHGYVSSRVLQHQPGEVIDVYTFQHDAAAALIGGTNPYTITQLDIYSRPGLYAKDAVINGRVQVGLPYPPLSLFFVLPGYLLGDLRYSYVVAVALSAVVMVAISVNRFTLIAACLLLLNPITFLVQARAWTEPFVLLTLTLTVYAALGRRAWLPLALGLFLASKQYTVLAIPFVPFLMSDFRWRSYGRILMQSIAVGACVTIPMALWNVRAFWHDIVQFEMAQPFRQDSLSLAVLFPIPLSVALVSVVIATAWAFKRAKPHPSMFAGCYAFTLLIFVSTNKQAFCNYYFLITQTLLLCAATLRIPVREPCLEENSKKFFALGKLLSQSESGQTKVTS